MADEETVEADRFDFMADLIGVEEEVSDDDEENDSTLPDDDADAAAVGAIVTFRFVGLRKSGLFYSSSSTMLRVPTRLPPGAADTEAVDEEELSLDILSSSPSPLGRVMATIGMGRKRGSFISDGGGASANAEVAPAAAPVLPPPGTRKRGAGITGLPLILALALPMTI
jgi:hypothetical protein